MNPEVRDLWTAALRSGDYVQGSGKLVRLPLPDDPDARQYCCLGVLCELAARRGVVADVRLRDDLVAYDEQTNYLPRSVQEWAGLQGHGSNPHVRCSGTLRTLGDLNDAHVHFNRIAELIEEQL